jgi:hypothetical protein
MPTAALPARLAAQTEQTPDDQPTPEEIIIQTIDRILGGRVLTPRVRA